MKDLLAPSPEILIAPTSREIGRTALIAIAGFTLYGYTVGFWRSPMMGVFVAVKMPLLIALTLGCNGLLNGLLGLLLGSGLGFRQSLHALLSGFAISGLILGAVAPVTLFLAVNVPDAGSAQAASSHAAYLLSHVSLIGIAGLTGLMKLAILLKSYCSSPLIARSTLGAWIAGNAILGMQFSWILRPFFGSPKLKVAFLRDDPMKGSFFEAVWNALQRISRNVPEEGLIGLGGLSIIALIIFFQIKHEQKKHIP